MKFYILPINSEFQPDSQMFKYPKHNKDYGVEQDFYKYLTENIDLMAETPDQADWHYLPVFWTRWHLNHDYGKLGLDELQKEVDSTIINDAKTFTICQYDDGPVANLGKAVVFLSSRKDETGIDIPLLSSPHSKPFFKPAKKYLSSFVGRLSTQPLRQEMAKCLQDMDSTFIYDGDKGTKFFVKKTLESYVALCPRGYGGSSFRLFESMQLGVVPFLIGDIDTRPFKKFINWNGISFFSNASDNIRDMLETFNKSELTLMGGRAEIVWKEELSYQNWCKYVIKELETIT